MLSQHLCLFLFIYVWGEVWGLGVGCLICDLHTLAGKHLNVLQVCMCVCPPCGSAYAYVFFVFFLVLAGQMKYSWWHGGIGSRAKSRLTGLSGARCLLKHLSLSRLSLSLSLYKEMSRGKGNIQVRQCLC